MKNDKVLPTKQLGFLSIILVSLVLISQIFLGTYFDFEGKPIEYVLTLYQTELPVIEAVWMIFVVGVMLIIPLALLFECCFDKGTRWLQKTATCFGVLTGVFYAAGIMRWVLLAESLSSKFAADPNGVGGKISAEIFSAFNVYCGNGFGETLAPLCHAAFAICLGLVILSDKTITNRVTKLFAHSQMIIGAGIALRPAEYIGFLSVGKTADLFGSAWAVVLLIYGIYMLFAKDILKSGKEHSRTETMRC